MKTSSSLQPYPRLNPLNDYLFLKVMGERGSEIQLLGFLNAVLGRTESNMLVSVEIIENRILSAESIGAKSSVLDVRAMLEDGTRVNIEVQLRNLNNFDKRSLFYWSKEYTKGIKSGQDYAYLPTVININIIDFEFLETENFHTVFHLKEDKESNLILTEILEIHFINMVKWRKCGNIDIANEPLHRWLTWFDKNSPAELIEEVAKMDKAIMAANERQIYFTNDDEEIRAYEMREMALMDERARISYATNEGLTQGRKEGRIEGLTEGRIEGRREGHSEGITEGLSKGKIEIAINALAEGFTPEIIQKITGLSEETIKELKKLASDNRDC